MDIDSTPQRNDRRSYPSRWELIEQSNCRFIFALALGLVALLCNLLLQAITPGLERSFAAGFWRAVSPWLSGCSMVVFLICLAVCCWNFYLLKLARDEKVAKVGVLEEHQKQTRLTTRLLEQAYKNQDNVKITQGEDHQIKTVEIVRTAVILEQARIQEAAKQARALSAPARPTPQLQSPGQSSPSRGPLPVSRKLIVPAGYDLMDVLPRWSLSEENIFLGIDSEKQMIGCNPGLELCHGAFNAVSGRGKTITIRGIETQLLKTGYEVVHADIKFSLIDEKGNDYKPIARALLEQGNIEGLGLPHLLVREDHIVRLLEWLAGPELMRRLALYNQGLHTYKTFFLFLEELLYLIGKYKHLGALISPLLSVGRSLGIKVFAVAQNFQVQNLKINSGMRENFESAWFLGGDIRSGASILDMTETELKALLFENNIALGKGVSIFRNNSVAYEARVMRGGMASNDFVYWMLGHADELRLPDSILPSLGVPEPETVVESGPSGEWAGRSQEAVNEPVEGAGATPNERPLRPFPMMTEIQVTSFKALYPKIGSIDGTLDSIEGCNHRHRDHARLLIQQYGLVKEKRA